MKNLKYYLPIIVALLFIASCSSDDDLGPTCNDGVRNGTEIGIDCGGDCPDCETCFDNVQNGNETGVDCGGSCAPCATCNDNIQNGNETGVDCGGSLCPVCPTCDDGIQNGDETGVDCGGGCALCHAIGSVGPAGGTVFYDKGNYNDGWRYMESGPALQGSNGQWGCTNFDVGGTLQEIGSGPVNTEQIIIAFSLSGCNPIPTAARECSSFQYGGFDDWFLPSVDEIKELWPLRFDLLLGNQPFWTSSEFDAVDVYVVNFGAASIENSVFTWFKIPTSGQQGVANILPVRRF